MKTAQEFMQHIADNMDTLTDEDVTALIEARDREVAVKILRDAATVAYAKNLLAAHSFLLDRAERAEREAAR